MKVVELKKPVSRDVVDLTAQIADDAAEGEIVGFAAVGLCADGGTIIYRAGQQNAATIGRLEDLKFRILREFSGS